MVDARFFPCTQGQTLQELLVLAGHASLSDVSVYAEFVVEGVGELETAGGRELAVAANKQYTDALKSSKAGAALVTKELEESVPSGSIAIVADDPRGVFTDVLDVLYPDASRQLVERTNQASPTTGKREDGVLVGPGTLIGVGAEIGSGTTIGPNCVIGAGVAIGRNCVIGANVTIECALMGNDIFVQPGARIGVEGFGWLEHGAVNRKVPQLGRVIVQDKVQIGANTVIDRGALGDTTIGENTKIDNLVQIGHNSKLGRNCLIAATSGLSGSTVFGDSVLVGGGVGTAGHLSVGSNSLINGRAAVTKDWPEGSKLAGAPAQDAKDFWRELAVLRRLTKGGIK